MAEPNSSTRSVCSVATLAAATLLGGGAASGDQAAEIHQAYKAAYAVGDSQKSCLDAIGHHLAEVLVQWCETHASENAYCDVGNSCRVIIDAIRTNCESAPIPCYDPY